MSVVALAELVRSHQPCVALTGAGVSTESGIPDFRGAEGVWRNVDDPMEYASIDAFRRDPAKVWSHYGPRLAMLSEAEPNEGHRALAELERRGFVEALVTQNIDLLHERAGSRNLVEVHGSIRTSSCRRCGRRYPLVRVLELLPVPACSDCAEVLKPDVVFFGELLPVDEIDRAFELAETAALLLIVGSTLEVHPVAGLPDVTRSHGGQVAIVNLGPTSWDDRADLRIEGGAGEILSALVRVLDR